VEPSSHLRVTFDSAAELYARARPGYPEQLYTDLLAITGLDPPARLLEIGPGTGQATLPLAQRGFAITAIELGANLAAAARRNLAAFPAVDVQVAEFESWPLPEQPFDMVFSATAFHWLEPSARLERCAAALRRGGWLAVWNSLHVDGGDERFFVDVQECYERWMPGTPPGLRLAPPATVADDSLGLEGSPYFEPPQFRRYFWTRRYTRDDYREVLRTYSGHIALGEPNLTRLLACIGTLIDVWYGGSVRKAYLTQLTVTRRR
jgi:SAM-dependent methyltransferase